MMVEKPEDGLTFVLKGSHDYLNINDHVTQNSINATGPSTTINEHALDRVLFLSYGLSRHSPPL
jgi:hypothetical protein